LQAPEAHLAGWLTTTRMRITKSMGRNIFLTKELLMSRVPWTAAGHPKKVG
jgi:hypothetical protein